MESGRSLVVHFKAYASAEDAALYVLPVPDFNDIVVHEVTRRRVAGEIFTDAGQELELRREQRFQRVFVIKGFYDRYGGMLRGRENVRNWARAAIRYQALSPWPRRSGAMIRQR